MQQARNAADQVLFVLVDVTVRVAHLPQHFDDCQFVRLWKLSVEAMRELVKGHGSVGSFDRTRDQRIHRFHVQAEATAQQLTNGV
jgi:hypothetical protein